VRSAFTACLVAFAVGLAATVAAERLARRAGLVTQPREDRWHRQPVPLLGGVAIVVALLAGLAAARLPVGRFGPFLLTAIIMGAVGLRDDVRPLRPQTKLVAQIVLAAVLIQLGYVLPLTPSMLVNILLTLLWVVGITNALNLLDNMDGLAAGMAVIAALLRLAFFVIDGDPGGATLAGAFAGAVAGFLVRNAPPAKIFMGDAGSLFLGFFLAGLCLVGEYAYSRGVAAVLVIPVLLLVIPIFDTTFVTLTRLATGRPVSQGGRDHTSHRLVGLGITERQALAFLYTVSILSGCVAILSYEYGFAYTIALLAVLLIGLVLLGVHLSRVQILRSDRRAEGPMLRLVADLPYKRQVAMVAIDLLLIVTAYYAAYLLRFENEFGLYRTTFLQTLGPVIIIQVLALALAGIYRPLWRYTSFSDLLGLIRGVTAAAAATVLYLLFATRFENLSRAVFVLDWLLLLILLAGSRASFRLLGELLRPARPDFSRVLIYGAGDGGELTLRELRKNARLRRDPVGFLDDDRSKIGTHIHGVPVLGGLEQAADVLERHRVEEVIVASDKIPAEAVHRLESICARQGILTVRASMRIG
jgi:UDP-GlcNAc:undecaprenyl-phosphate GlcNAc-1-phosphate transferase